MLPQQENSCLLLNELLSASLYNFYFFIIGLLEDENFFVFFAHQRGWDGILSFSYSLLNLLLHLGFECVGFSLYVDDLLGEPITLIRQVLDYCSIGVSKIPYNCSCFISYFLFWLIGNLPKGFRILKDNYFLTQFINISFVRDLS